MLADMVAATRRHGLELHPAKTKIVTSLSKRAGSACACAADIEGTSIEMLPHFGKLKYLGQLITFYSAKDTELQHRLWSSWATFHHPKHELTSSNYPLSHRLRLFDST
eukprot:6508752-Pyramimonas_sp.AAC.1